MDKQRMKVFRLRLQEERDRLQQQVGHFQEWGLGEAETDAVGELSAYDQHSSDLASETLARSQDIGLRDRARLQMAEVDQALERLQAGDYGVCIVCGGPIGEGRLQAMPTASRCARCQALTEGDQDPTRRPVEEAVLEPPFGRSFRDGDESVMYDGEDAWQEVARYGNANTPQDVPDAVDYQEVFVDANEDIGTVEEVESIADVEGEGVVDPTTIHPEPRDAQERRRHRQRRRL